MASEAYGSSCLRGPKPPLRRAKAWLRFMHNIRSCVAAVKAPPAERHYAPAPPVRPVSQRRAVLQAARATFGCRPRPHRAP